MAISWYHSSTCGAVTNIVPGDCHGPKGPRNDTVVISWHITVTTVNNNLLYQITNKIRTIKNAKLNKLKFRM